MGNKKRSREVILKHGILATVFLIAGFCAVFMRRFLVGNIALDFVTNMLGTITWAGLVTVLLSFIFFPYKHRNIIVPAVAICFCFGMEFLQLTPIPSTVSRAIPALRLVFGSTYAASDLPWYLIGVLFAWVLIHFCIRSKGK